MWEQIVKDLKTKGVQLVAVSKTKPKEAILQIYEKGQRIFGENYVQELVQKYNELPKDIDWHLIGHLQRNKVKYIIPFIKMIHSVDSLELLQTIQDLAKKNERMVDVLLQIKIATEETKTGMSFSVAEKISTEYLEEWTHVRIRGVMGMASLSDDTEVTRKEFRLLKSYFDSLENHFVKNKLDYFSEICMGISDDYLIGIEEGATMVRIGSLIFGKR